MEIHRELERLDLLDGIPANERRWLLSMMTPQSRSWPEGSVILNQGSTYDALQVLVSGESYAEMLDSKGKVLRIEAFDAPCAFAPAVLFASDNRMPGSVIASTPCRTVTFSKVDVFRLCSQSDRFLENLLRLVSDRFMFLSRRISFLSFHTIREKVVSYLLGLPGAESGRVTLGMPLEKLSEYFGVTRPSLSRVFLDLEERGEIARTGKRVDITNLSADAAGGAR